MSDRAVRLASVVLAAALILAGVGATGSTASAQSADTIAGTQVDPDDVSLRVDLREDGSAAWTIEYRVRLDDDNTTQAFESLQDDIAANDTGYVAEFRGRMVATADTAENTTGRAMAIRNVSVEASQQQLPQEYGVLTYTFVWTNFAVVDDGSITAGDALAGFFLDTETALQLSWPASYDVETVQPDPDDLRTESRLAAWNGPVEFGANEPTLVVTEAAADGTTTTAPPGGGDSGDGGTDSRTDSDSSLPIGAILVGGLIAAIAGWVLYRQRDAGGTAGAPDAATAGAGAPPGSTDDDGATGTSAAAGTTAEGDAGPDDGAVAAGDSGDDADGATAPPWEDELLSNQEKVLALVEHEGGRMKQQEVAQTLEWTDAKTSQVVGDMRDEGDLDAFRLGRENVLVLPGEEFGPSGPGDEDGE